VEISRRSSSLNARINVAIRIDGDSRRGGAAQFLRRCGKAFIGFAIHLLPLASRRAERKSLVIRVVCMRIDRDHRCLGSICSLHLRITLN
jgi:hypothetical protein